MMRIKPTPIDSVNKKNGCETFNISQPFSLYIEAKFKQFQVTTKTLLNLRFNSGLEIPVISQAFSGVAQVCVCAAIGFFHILQFFRGVFTHRAQK